MFVFALSLDAVAIGKNNPISSTEQQTYSGPILAFYDQSFEFTVDEIEYIVHVPQYVDLGILNLEVDQTVEVTGFLRLTTCHNVLYPTIINGIVLEDLKPLDGI